MVMLIPLYVLRDRRGILGSRSLTTGSLGPRSAQAFFGGNAIAVKSTEEVLHHAHAVPLVG